MSPPDSKIKYSVFYVYLSSCIILCYFTGIFYAVVRQFSMLFIDYKDYVLCILRVCVCVVNVRVEASTWGVRSPVG